jgi:uncharacterized protein YqeY
MRFYSAEAMPAPPLLIKMRGDLKAAMKTKDAARLSVLRALMASTLNASKTSSPIKTNAQMVALLKKHMTASRDAADEFAQAGRQDLAEKEQSQAAIMAEYVQEGGMRELSDEALQGIIIATKSEAVADGVKPQQLLSEILRSLMAPNGPLEAFEVDKKDVVTRVRQLIK